MEHPKSQCRSRSKILIFSCVIILCFAVTLEIALTSTSTCLKWFTNFSRPPIARPIANDEPSENCQHDEDRRPNDYTDCPDGSFYLSTMISCQPWLTCHDIANDVTIGDPLGQGAVKRVHHGQWNGMTVAVSFANSEDFNEDFKLNIEMLKLYNTGEARKSRRFVQLIGWCLSGEPIIVTEYHLFGTADKIAAKIHNEFEKTHYLFQMFQFCINFVEILDILHTYNSEVRVLCDANDPEKALSQTLVTSDFHLVLNDMDALALVDKTAAKLVQCGRRELGGEYVAPEQLWPYPNLSFDHHLMPHYDEKVDIWKIPDVCNTLLEETSGASTLMLHLFNIHSRCKAKLPIDRPTAAEVLQYYHKILDKLKLSV